MIGLDTNVIVRFLTGDDPVQSPQALEVFRGLTPEQPGFIPLVVAVETAWVLSASYKLSSTGVLDAIEGLLNADDLVIEQEGVVRAALSAARAGLGFADAVVLSSALVAGCAQVVTFDRKAAATNEDFALLG